MVFTDPGHISPSTIYTYDTSAHISWSMESQECSEAVLNYTIFYSNTQTGVTLSESTAL